MSLYVDIEKKLGSFHLKVQLSCEEETVALLGTSGSGKSMTLRCIAGIEKPDRGQILLNGVPLFDSEKKIDLPPQKRRVGLLFQNYALFPNMTVRENILFGAFREPRASKRAEKAAEIMERFGIAELASHYPKALSGGQQQRTALARLLISEPELLLLDEPFSALDSHLRFQLEQEVQQRLRAFGKGVLFVSHDREEAFRLSEKIAVMEQGTIAVLGEKHEVFRNPQKRSAAIITGCRNLSKAVRIDETRVRAVDWGIDLMIPADQETPEYAGIRSRDILCGEGQHSIRCTVLSQTENPFSTTVLLKPEGTECTSPLCWDVPQKLTSDQVEILLPSEAIIWLKE